MYLDRGVAPVIVNEKDYLTPFSLVYTEARLLL